MKQFLQKLALRKLVMTFWNKLVLLSADFETLFIFVDFANFRFLQNLNFALTTTFSRICQASSLEPKFHFHTVLVFAQ